MDLTTALIGFVLVAIAVLPFIYFSNAQKKEKKKFLNSYMDLAAQEQLVISQYEVWSHYCAIGIDAHANKLFYYKKRGDKEQKLQLNLAEVEKCTVINTKRTLNEDQVIDRLELVFVFSNTRLPEKRVEFYSKEETMSINDELQLVEKWKSIISLHLASNHQQGAKKKVLQPG